MRGKLHFLNDTAGDIYRSYFALKGYVSSLWSWKQKDQNG